MKKKKKKKKKASQCVDTFPGRRISRGGNESSSIPPTDGNHRQLLYATIVRCAALRCAARLLAATKAITAAKHRHGPTFV